MTRLEQLAGEVAILAPIRRNKWAVDATIPWDVIEDIRAEMERLEIDWLALALKLRNDLR